MGRTEHDQLCSQVSRRDDKRCSQATCVRAVQQAGIQAILSGPAGNSWVPSVDIQRWKPGGSYALERARSIKNLALTLVEPERGSALSPGRAGNSLGRKERLTPRQATEPGKSAPGRSLAEEPNPPGKG